MFLLFCSALPIFINKMATLVNSIRLDHLFNMSVKYIYLIFEHFFLSQVSHCLMLFQGRCYSGECKTRDSQCKYIWGSSEFLPSENVITCSRQKNTSPAAPPVSFSSFRGGRVRETLLWKVKYRGDRKRELWERWRQMDTLQQTVSVFIAFIF